MKVAEAKCKIWKIKQTKTLLTQFQLFIFYKPACTQKSIHGRVLSIRVYIIAQDILAFWLVLAYDLLEDRRTIDVITTKFFTLCFKMAENFENLDNILRDWAKDKVQKSLVEALNRHEKQREER